MGAVDMEGALPDNDQYGCSPHLKPLGQGEEGFYAAKENSPEDQHTT
jgi:hypothetical protein